MKTSSPTTWRREVLESHLGLSRGTTSTRKNVHRLDHHPRLAEESFWQHCDEGHHALCLTAATVEVVGRNIVFIRAEAMDIGVPLTGAEAPPHIGVCAHLHLVPTKRSLCSPALVHYAAYAFVSTLGQSVGNKCHHPLLVHFHVMRAPCRWARASRELRPS